MINGIYNASPRHLHLEPTSDCNARCPQCPRTFFTSTITDPRLVISEWSPEELSEILETDYFAGLRKILVNGNYGDIVKHSQPKELLEVVLKRNTEVEIRTNGGALPISFWTWLGQQKNVLVEFGIDGLSDTHHLYRRNTRFDIVIKNAKAYIAAGGRASWAMTLFKNNEHQEKECQKLSKDLGFSSFKSRASTRWLNSNLIVVDKNFDQEYILEPASSLKGRFSAKPAEDATPLSFYENAQKEIEFDLSTAKVVHKDIKNNKISCVAANSTSVYLSADKKLWPCCWIGHNVQAAIKTNKKTSFIEKFFCEKGYDLDFNNVIKNSIADIVSSGLFSEIENSWKETPFDECSAMCSKNSNWNMQIKKTKTSKFGKNK